MYSHLAYFDEKRTGGDRKIFRASQKNNLIKWKEMPDSDRRWKSRRMRNILRKRVQFNIQFIFVRGGKERRIGQMRELASERAFDGDFAQPFAYCTLGACRVEPVFRPHTLARKSTLRKHCSDATCPRTFSTRERSGIRVADTRDKCSHRSPRVSHRSPRSRIKRR